ncbi:TATA box-binding protein-associated factor RNA polymerase I subunit B [Lacerta agilis]|uniref:TATA box-binding protein-associated factor RNA polymerase I subunit B n=1 Tax=Lacerta agilis TaxID=80427 RepID=UPI00141A130F|nr:TATA box-binding protein-associated factor RNA polymerase I subunit B [Lacerta agilis]
MEEEEARDYNEPCVQCSDINWGLTEEGKFYCRSCHNVIERTREVITSEATTNARAQSISRGLKKKKKLESGWEWYICEGFQFILSKQADALQALGVSSQFKDDVLCKFWRIYLQKSQQAYCDKPRREVAHSISSMCDSDTDVDRELEISRILALASSASDTDVVSESSMEGASSTGTSNLSGKFLWSGSVDAASYLQKRKKGEIRMSMPMTMAFCYLALLWLRESITLSHLLRLVMDGHIPYLNAYKDFPEEMKVYGTDCKLFHVKNWPAYEDVHKKAQALAVYLKLPCFPDIAEDSFLHPNILCMKYLMEANLPDDMHKWACRVVKKTGVGETDFLTLRPENISARNVKYDILAVAVVVVVLKMLFLLDDQYEWLLADYAEERNKRKEEGCPVFDIRKWYLVVKNALDVEQKKINEGRIRLLWRCEKPLLFFFHETYNFLKKRRMAVDLQRQFRALSGSVEPTEKRSPSSFQLNWTEEMDCFHGHSLVGILQPEGDKITTLNRKYWLCTTALCKNKHCGHLAYFKESNFPHAYQFVLNLFSFILRVEPSLIHEEVCAIEHKLFYSELRRTSTFSKV